VARDPRRWRRRQVDQQPLQQRCEQQHPEQQHPEQQHPEQQQQQQQPLQQQQQQQRPPLQQQPEQQQPEQQQPPEPQWSEPEQPDQPESRSEDESTGTGGPSPFPQLRPAPDASPSPGPLPAPQQLQRRADHQPPPAATPSRGPLPHLAAPSPSRGTAAATTAKHTTITSKSNNTSQPRRDSGDDGDAPMPCADLVVARMAASSSSWTGALVVNGTEVRAGEFSDRESARRACELLAAALWGREGAAVALALGTLQVEGVGGGDESNTGGDSSARQPAWEVAGASVIEAIRGRARAHYSRLYDRTQKWVRAQQQQLNESGVDAGAARRRRAEARQQAAAAAMQAEVEQPQGPARAQEEARTGQVTNNTDTAAAPDQPSPLPSAAQSQLRPTTTHTSGGTHDHHTPPSAVAARTDRAPDGAPAAKRRRADGLAVADAAPRLAGDQVGGGARSRGSGSMCKTRRQRQEALAGRLQAYSVDLSVDEDDILGAVARSVPVAPYLGGGKQGEGPATVQAAPGPKEVIELLGQEGSEGSEGSE